MVRFCKHVLARPYSFPNPFSEKEIAVLENKLSFSECMKTGISALLNFL